MKFAANSARMFSLVLVGILALNTAPALAQTPEAGALAPGAATQLAEAPGGTRLDPAGHAIDTTPAAANIPAPAGDDAAGSRAMSFGSNRGECRDTVPGGSLLALAYALILLAMGVYTARLAQRNAQLAADIEELEAQFEKRSGAKKEPSP